MISVKKLDAWKLTKFDDIPNFTFFERDDALFYKVPAVFEPGALGPDTYKGPSWNCIRVENGATYLLNNSAIVVMVDITISYKTTDKLST